jgi:hypothetical protein
MCGLAKEVVCMLYQRLAASCLLVRLCMLIQAQSLTLVSQTCHAVTVQSRERERERERMKVDAGAVDAMYICVANAHECKVARRTLNVLLPVRF